MQDVIQPLFYRSKELGVLTDIFNIDAPVSAEAGSIITVTVSVQNIFSANLYVTITGRIDGIDTQFGGNTVLMGAGGLAAFQETFIMPDHDVAIYVWSFAIPNLGIPWPAYDDNGQTDVSLEGAPTEGRVGEIDYVRIKIGSLEQSLPASGIEVGDRFTFRVKVKNTGTVSYRPYLYYRYTKPDGSVLGSSEAKFTDLDPNNYHTFSEPAFGIPIDQPGNWYVYCELRDDYSGNVLDTFTSALVFTAGGTIPYTDLANVDIIITPGTYRIGEIVPFSFAYDYRGPAQLGFLTIILASFDPVYTFPGVVEELSASSEWASGIITGYIVIPSSVVPGYIYNIIGVFRTEDNEVEKSDYDPNIITIREIPPLTGTIGTMRLREFLITKDLPALDMVVNDPFVILVPVENTSEYEGRFFLDCIIIKPSGITTGRVGEQQNLNPGQKHTYEIQPEGWANAYVVDETGDWYVQAILRSEAEELTYTPQVHLFTAGSEGATSDLQVYDLEATLPTAHPILAPLDILPVGVTFKYISTENIELELWASLALGIGRDIETRNMIQLEASATENTWSGTINLEIPESGKTDGEYTLRVEVAGVEVVYDKVVTIVGMPQTGWSQIGDIIPLMMIIMMMNLLMGMFEDPRGFAIAVEEKAKKVTGVIKRIPGVGRILK